MRDRAMRVAQQLVLASGRYLRNTVREHTCTVCTSPVYEGPLCEHCAAAGEELDLVAPLVYAVGGEQSARILRGYKDARNPNVQNRHANTVAQLLFVGIQWHQGCLERAVGQPVSATMTVPSTRQAHPFEMIGRDLGNAGRFAPDADLAGQHVLLLDDTWASGATVRSAAHALRDAGAATVSALTVGRWLNPEFESNATFLDTYAAREYDPRLCPVTGIRCR